MDVTEWQNTIWIYLNPDYQGMVLKPVENNDGLMAGAFLQVCTRKSVWSPERDTPLVHKAFLCFLMGGIMQKKKCPFCSEEILVDAKKCKHCGEWLDKPVQSINDRGSADARAVAKGIKEKERDDSAMGCCGVIALAVAIAVGSYIHWIVGAILFVVLLILSVKMYYNE